MRRIGAISGTLLIAMIIIISGSAVATWVYATSIHSYSNCTNRTDILGSEDDFHATIGRNPSSYGWIIVALDAGHGMDAKTNFTVFAYGSGFSNDKVEDYDVSVSMSPTNFQYVGSDDDQEPHNFTTPNYGSDWRYIYIVGTSGDIGLGDPYYGPEITAVGWDEP